MQGNKNALDTPEYKVEFWTVGTDTMAPQFIVDTDMLMTGNALDFTVTLDGSDEIQLVISMTEFEKRCAAINIEPRNALDPSRTEIRVLANGVLKAMGEVYTVEADLGTEEPTLQIKALGWLSSFKKQYISNYDYVYSNLTYAQIARQVVLDSQYGVNLLRQSILSTHPNYSLLPNIKSEYFDFGYGTTGYNQTGFIADNRWSTSSNTTITLDTSTYSPNGSSTQSLKVVNSGTNQNAGVSYAFTGNTTAANYNSLTLQSGGLTYYGRSYILMFDVKKMTANMNMGYGLVTASGSISWGVISSETTTDWQTCTITIPEPSSPVTALIIQCMVSAGSPYGNFWLSHVWFCRDGQEKENRKLWIELGDDTASADQSATRLREYDNKCAYDSITSLVRLQEDNFDFDFTVSDDGHTRYFNTYSRKGSDKSNVELIQSINNSNPVANVATSTITRSSETLYNYVHALGSGSGTARLENHEWSTQSEQVYRRRDQVQTWNSTTEMTTLEEDATGFVQYYDYIYNEPSFVLAPGRVDRNSIEVGDKVYVEVTGSTYVNDVNDMYKIDAIETTLDQNNSEQLTLTFDTYQGDFTVGTEESES